MKKVYDTPQELAHIWEYLNEDEHGCWNWSGALDANNCPRIGVHIKGQRPHPTRTVRPVIHELATGERLHPEFQRIYNRCKNKRCVSVDPRHNELVELQSPRALVARATAIEAKDNEPF